MPETITIPDRVRNAMAERLGLDLDRLTDGASLTDDLGVDSLDMIEAVASIETEFDVIISLDEQASWRTVGDVIRAVEAER
jgi:acyl carrier protein